MAAGRRATSSISTCWVRWRPPPRPRAATQRSIYRVLNGTGYIGDEDPDAVIPQTFGRRGGLMGNPDKILATIDEFVELGVDTFHLQFPNDILEQQLTQFGEEVIAKVRG